MKVEFTPLTASLLPACRAFNERMRAHGEPPFLLPEHLPGDDAFAAEGAISSTHYLAVDGSGAVRGGALLLEQRGWLNQRVVPLINLQSPISEGLVDRSFSGVSLQMLKFVMGRTPYLYAVGMGNEQNPFPRLLRAGGWSVNPVPFEFTVTRARRFLKEIGTLREGYRKWLARTAAAFGLGSLALTAWRLSHIRPALRHYSLELANSWPSGADRVWERCRAEVSFSVLRDEPTLASLYPDTQPRLKRFILLFDGEMVGWSVGLVTKMNKDVHFGDLVVGTLLDGLAYDRHLRALVALTRNALADLGADVILTNQTHGNWNAESRRLGFFRSSSNYLLALSSALVAGLESQAGALDRIHVNRGDGDGRLHL